jgi:ABC-2 type transport system ATP-binding protein
MEEAERPCDRVAIIDHGRIVDIDSPPPVARHCPERLELRLTMRMPTRFKAIRGVDAGSATTAASRSAAAAKTSSPTDPVPVGTSHP